MAYIGNNLKAAYRSYKIIDDISSSFNGVLTTFALEVSGTTPVPFPINPQQCLISVNGVVLEPDPTGTSGFNLVGTNIVFVTPPTNGHSFFGVILAGADYVNVGVTYPSGSESVPSISFDSDLDTGIFNPASNEIAIVTGGTSRVRVSTSGQVGIGITPTSLLHVNGDIKTEGQFLGALSGNASTATSLQSAQSFGLTGDVTGTVNSDLSSGVSIDTTIASESVSTTELGGDITAAGKALLDDADAATQRTTLGLATVASTGEYSDLLNIPPVGGGSVTSVALTVPTGFLVSGSPVTTSGTLALTYASGYQGYTTTEATKLTGIADGAQVNVKSDWNSTTGDSEILNKPTLGAAAALNIGTSAGTVAAGNDGRFHDTVTLATTVSDVFALSGQQISTTNPGSNQLVFWDDNNSKITYLAIGSNLSIAETTLNASISPGTITNADISASAGIEFSKLNSLSGGQIIIGNNLNVPTAATISGDISLSNTGVASIASGAIVNADINALAAIDFNKLASLTDSQIIVGNVSNVPTAVSVTGDIAISNTGVTSIASDAIVDADVNASAAIAFSKLAALTGGHIIVGNSSNIPTAVSVTGDIAISNTGVTSIASGVIVDADINASAAIADTKLGTISTAGKVSNSATTATNANTASAIVARDGSGNFSAGTITAALTGNASTATALSSTRTFALTGDVTGTANSDLSGGVNILTSLALSIVNADVDANANIAGSKIQAATTSNAGAVQLNDTVTSTSTSQAATANAVKTAYDLADNAIPESGGRFTGDVVISGANKLVIGTTESTGDQKLKIQGQVGNSNAGAIVVLARGNTPPTAGNFLGTISFRDDEENRGAEIRGESDIAWSSGNYGGRLKFLTTALNGSAPLERWEIDRSGQLTSLADGGGIDCVSIYDTTTSGNTANVYIGAGGLLQRADGSSIKYKKDVETIENSYADAILDCRPVWYRSICSGDRPDHSFWGFIAEEVAEIDPRLVHFKTVDVTFENGKKIETPCDPEPESVHYNRFVPHLVNLVRRQRDQIQSLEDRVLALENS